MFQFEHPEYLYYLWIIPVLILLVWLFSRSRKKQALKMGDEALISNLQNPGLCRSRRWKTGLFIIGITLLIFSLSNPQWGTKRETVKVERSDIVIALDVSQSMLAEDLKPSRLDRAKIAALRLVRDLRGNRIGLIVFAGNAYLQMPLTTDYAAAELFVKTAEPSVAGTQGTSLADAILLGIKSFPQDKAAHKSLILLTDGEDHEKGVENALDEAAEKGMTIFSVGVGTPAGAQIEVDGQTVVTAPDFDLLRGIARQTGGEFFPLHNEEELSESIRSRIERFQKREMEERSFSEFESYYQWFAIAGWLALFASWIFPYRENTLT
ncbi:MAG: VWA domain-containing protein [Saprospiraceae bacterium]|nr:VWA domain-containing protein [Saprospiraceae bacterium]